MGAKGTVTALRKHLEAAAGEANQLAYKADSKAYWAERGGNKKYKLFDRLEREIMDLADEF